MISGIDNKNLFIINFCKYMINTPPANRLMDIKCIQNIIRKFLLENKSVVSSIPRYRLKLHQNRMNLNKICIIKIYMRRLI